MAVAAHHLCGGRFDAETERGEHLVLDPRIDVAVRTNGAGQLADRDAIDGLREARMGAVELEDPADQLESKRGRLGVHAVGTTHARGGAVLQRALEHGGTRLLEALQQDRAGIAQLQCQPGVDHVARGEAVVEPACGRPDLLGNRLGERDHVVVRALLDLLGPRDVNTRVLADRRGILSRHHAKRHVRVGRSELDLQPCAKSSLVCPDGAHPRSRVAGDHSHQTSQRAGWRLQAAARPHPLRGLARDLTDAVVVRVVVQHRNVGELRRRGD